MTFFLALFLVPCVLGSVSGLVYEGRLAHKTLSRYGGYLSFYGVGLFFVTLYVTRTFTEFGSLKNPLLTIAVLLFAIGLFMQTRAWVLKKRNINSGS